MRPQHYFIIHLIEKHQLKIIIAVKKRKTTDSGESLVETNFSKKGGVGGNAIQTASLDRSMLNDFYHVTNGPSWHLNQGWDSDQPLERWAGVIVNETGSVIGLDLKSFGIEGAIYHILY